MSINYGTSSSCNDACTFKKDYSYIVNGKCLGCKFCYRLTESRPSEKRRTASLLPHEGKISPSLYTQPITISRYCDPFYNNTSTRNSISAMRHILESGGRIILRTSQANIPEEAFNLLVKYKDMVQFQPRIIAADTNNGNIVKSLIAPKFDDCADLLYTSKLLLDKGVDIAVYFDPFILFVNSADCALVMKSASELGINKIIIRQLFATDEFKAWLNRYGPPLCTMYLKIKVGPYWTYEGRQFFENIQATISHAVIYDMSISVCGNKECDTIINCYYENCCQFNERICDESPMEHK